MSMNTQIQLMVAQGLQAFQTGNFDSANLILKRVLQADLKNLQALQILGLIRASQGNYKEAADFLGKAARINPNDASLQYNLAKALTDSGNNKDAITHHKKAVALAPNNPEAWLSYGKTASNLFRYDDAIAHYDKALSLKPDYAEAALNNGVVMYELKRYDEAIVYAEKALAIKPSFFEAWVLNGSALCELKRYEEGIAHYDKALSFNPDDAEIWLNKGSALRELRRYDDAIAHYDKALSFNPDDAEIWLNKGSALRELRRYDDAIAHYDKALSLKPDYAEAALNNGVVMYELKRYDEAIVYAEKALAIKPSFFEAWRNKGSALCELKRYEEGIAHYDKALSLNSVSSWLCGDLLHTKMKMCSWSGLPKSLENICGKVMVKEQVIHPFSLLSLNDDALLHKKSSELYVQSKYPFNPVLGIIPRHPKNQKIRIGYFSADFKIHPVALLIAELFEIHNRVQFEIYAFSLVRANDEMRGRLFKAFDHFIDVEALSGLEIAQMTRNLEIDIAVDLTGLTKDSVTEIFSYRAAPIQVNYLGYPGTMGADYIDYIIADKILIPVESQADYSEKVVYLPNSYQVNDRKRLISDRVFTRKELGLPENGFIFCCFNNNFKILPVTFNSWMRILQEVEGSVLWLLQDNSYVVENLKEEAQKQGINPLRLIFAGRMPPSEHLARHRHADLFLDTWPYNAHTTTSDALWTGLPVLTMMGKSFASRVAASLLNAIDLPELITNTQEDYEAMAVDLATKPEKLNTVRKNLLENRLIRPLFNTPLFTKNLEAAYIKMYEKHLAELEPDHITIF